MSSDDPRIPRARLAHMQPQAQWQGQQLSPDRALQPGLEPQPLAGTLEGVRNAIFVVLVGLNRRRADGYNVVITPIYLIYMTK